MDDFLLIFSHIKIVKGYRKSLIINLQKETCSRYLNSDEFLEFVYTSSGKPISKLDEQMVLRVAQMEFGVVLPENLIGNFPPLEVGWDYPCKFSNGIFELKNVKEIEYTIQILKETSLRNIQLRVTDVLGNREFEILTKEILLSKVHNVQLVFLQENFIDDAILDLILSWRILSSIIVYCSQESKSYNVKGKLMAFVATEYRELWVINSPNDLILNMPFYQEAIGFNAYYNRKLFVSGNKMFSGNKDDGHTYFATVKEAFDFLSQKSSSWLMKKDDIDVCRDCEYRYSCFDRRIPKNRGENQYFNLRECSYNPYIGTWKGEEGYKTLKESGVISNREGFSINHKKMTQIIKELWGE